MEKEIIAALIAGSFCLLGAGISIWASITANNVRREMQVKLLDPRIEAYKKRWTHMEVASPSLITELEKKKREDLESELRK